MIDNLNLRLFDWSGNGAIGDDLIHEVIVQNLTEVCAEAGLAPRFRRIAGYHASILGGGTIFGHGTFFGQARTRILLDRKPFMIFGSGVRKPQTQLSARERERLKRFCDAARLVCVRGYTSRQWLEENGVQNVIVSGDAALGLRPLPVTDPAGDFKVGICPRLVKGGLRKEQQTGDNDRDIRLIAGICDLMVKKYRADLYFFDLNCNRFDKDCEAIESVRAAMREQAAARAATVYTFEHNRNPLIAFSRIGRMDFVVSKRMHPALMAWAQGVPTVGLEYQFDKTIDAFGSLGLEQCVTSIGDCSPEHYLELAQYALDNAEALLQLSHNNLEQLLSTQHACLIQFVKAI